MGQPEDNSPLPPLFLFGFKDEAGAPGTFLGPQPGRTGFHPAPDDGSSDFAIALDRPGPDGRASGWLLGRSRERLRTGNVAIDRFCDTASVLLALIGELQCNPDMENSGQMPESQMPRQGINFGGRWSSHLRNGQLSVFGQMECLWIVLKRRGEEILRTYSSKGPLPHLSRIVVESTDPLYWGEREKENLGLAKAELHEMAISEARSPGETPPKVLAGKEGRRKGGRPKLDAAEEHRRTDLVEKWKRAKEAGIAQKDFCLDKSITVGCLNKLVNWFRQRQKRSGEGI